MAFSWVSRGVVLALVVACCTTVALSTPREARAYEGPSPYQSLRTSGTSSSFFGKFRNFLRGGTTSQALAYGTLIGGESSTTRNGLNTQLYQARVGSRLLPRLITVGARVSIPITAAYFGWRVYQHFSNGDEATIDLWIDSDALGQDALLNPAAVPTGTPWATEAPGRFKWQGAGWELESGSGSCGAVGSGDCWVVELYPCVYWDASAATCGTTGTPEAYLTGPNGSPGFSTYAPSSRAHRRAFDVDDCAGIVDCYTGSGNGNTQARRNTMQYMITRTQENLAGREFGGYTLTDVELSHTVGGFTVGSHRLVLHYEGLDQNVTLNGSGTLTTPDEDTDYNVPSTAGQTNPDVTAALDAFDTPCGQTLINHLLLPDVYPWIDGCIEEAPSEPAEPLPDTETVPLLKPRLNETYTDYLERLALAGWIGSATTTEETTDSPEVGPEAVTRVKLDAGTRTYYTATWPGTPPRIALDADLDLWHNSADAPIVSDPGEGEEGGVDPGSDCEPWLEAEPDLSPLTGLDFGDKFPFALFGWVAGVIELFDVEPTAPSWDFHIVIPANPVGGPWDVGHLVIDLDWLDDYMSTIRLILTFVLWVGAIWYFATALLGFRAPGNPAEAVDDA